MREHFCIGVACLFAAYITFFHIQIIYTHLETETHITSPMSTLPVNSIVHHPSSLLSFDRPSHL